MYEISIRATTLIIEGRRITPPADDEPPWPKYFFWCAASSCSRADADYAD